LPTTLAAQPSTEPLLAGRPSQFSNIVGSYAIGVRAEPTSVPLEEPITLRVTISGKGPPKYQPRRKDLKLFPERWSRDFYIEPLPGEDRLQPEADTWEFVWRLRPRSEAVTAIDGVKLVYYQPGANGGRYQTARADAIEIKVSPGRPAGVVPEHLAVRTAPASFYDLPSTEAVLAFRERLARPPNWLIVVLLLAPPLLTSAGVWAWRRRAPMRRLQRIHEPTPAARRALQTLATTDGEAVWVVFGHYLRERLGFPAEEPTPAEVRRFLRRRGASRSMADQLAAFLGTCDAARFAAATTDGAAGLRAQAGTLIHALEEDLCTA
jgi:hypothetical protein